MKTLHFSILFAASLTLTGCGLARAPINILKQMIHSRVNKLKMRSDSTRTPDDFKLESNDVRKALADGKNTESSPEVTGTGLAQR